MRAQVQPVQEKAQQVGDFGACCAPVQVQFVEHEVKQTSVMLQPLPGRFEDVVVRLPHQHDAQHAVVGDENVRRRILHVPPAPHFGAVQSWKEVPRLVRSCFGVVFLGRSTRSLRELQLLNETVDLPLVRFAILVVLMSWYGSIAVVAAEVDPVASPTALQPVPCSLAVERPAKPSHLIFNESVHWIQEKRPDSRRPRFPSTLRHTAAST